MRKGKRIILLALVSVSFILSVYGLLRAFGNIDGQATEIPLTKPDKLATPSQDEPGSPTDHPGADIPVESQFPVSSLRQVGRTLIVENSGDDLDFTVYTFPHRLELVIRGRKLDPKTMPYEFSDEYFLRLDVSVTEEDAVLLVLYTAGPIALSYKTEDGDTQFLFSDPANPDLLVYRNSTTRQFFTLHDIFLGSMSDSSVLFFEGAYSEDGLTYTMTFERSRMKGLKDDFLLFRDELLEWVQVSNHDRYTTLTFRSTKKLVFNTNTRNHDSTITLIDPANGKNYIVIDPGHGGIDPGGVFGNRLEKFICLDISLLLAEELERRGYHVYLTREEDIFVGLSERIDIANLLGARLFISIHVNTFPGNTNIHGILSQYRHHRDLAAAIHRNVLATTGMRDTGIGFRNNLRVLNATTMPAMLFETGYLTNTGDWMRLNDPELQKRMAMGMANGIEEYLSTP